MHVQIDMRASMLLFVIVNCLELYESVQAQEVDPNQTGIKMVSDVWSMQLVNG